MCIYVKTNTVYNLLIIKKNYKRLQMFSKRLNRTRKSKGFTAQQMADLLHINIRSYSAYESADRSSNL